jgi:DNA-directed RNA polymerase subunit RPC12/RpoP
MTELIRRSRNMAICTRCNLKMLLADTETIDEVYELHSWRCRSCGGKFQMAMACADPFDEIPYFTVMMQPELRRAA